MAIADVATDCTTNGVITTVTPLGVRATNLAGVGWAAGRVRQYVEGPRSPDGTLDPLSAYYVDGLEGLVAGRVRGAGAAAFGLDTSVSGDQLERLLAGRHPTVDRPLLSSHGSAGRVDGSPSGSVLVAANGPDDEWLSLAQASFLTGVTPAYLRRLADRQHDSPRVGSAPVDSTAADPPRDYLRAVKDPQSGEWRATRGEVRRFFQDRLAPTTVLGFDVTTAAPKSVSLLWAFGTDRQRHQIAKAINAAVDVVIGYLEQHAAVGLVQGKPAAGQGLVVASYTHDIARTVEPHLHLHNLVMNVVRIPVMDADGKSVLDERGVPRVETRAVDRAALLGHAKTAGYLGAAELRHQLSTRLGVTWTRVHNGVAEIAGFPPKLLLDFSTARAKLLAEYASWELDATRPSGAALEAARRATRDAKPVLADAEIRARQRAQLERLGWTAERIQALAHPTRRHIEPFSDQEIAALFARLAGPEGVTARSTTFTARDVRQAVAAWAGDRLAAAEIDGLAHRFLADPRVALLDVTGIPGSRQLEPVYTTAGLLAVEDEILTRYQNGRTPRSGRWLAPLADDLIDLGVTEANDLLRHDAASWSASLSGEQVELVRRLVANGDQVRCAVGPAGTGKTEALRAAVCAWRAAGYPVIGAAARGMQAERLGRTLGIDTNNLAAWLTRWDTAAERAGNGALQPSTVIVVDEATQVDSRDAARLLRWADRTRSVVVAVGDPAQLSAVGPGGWFRTLTLADPDRVPRLEVIHRQKGAELAEVRQALSELRSGLPAKVERSLRRLAEDGRIRLFEDRDSLYDQVVADWYQQRARRDDIGDGQRPSTPSRMMAPTVAQCDTLNRRARRHLIADGTITGPELTAAWRDFAVGDEVVTLSQRGHTLIPDGAGRTDYVRTGTVGVVVEVHVNPDRPDTQHLVVDFDGKGRSRVDWHYLNHEFADGRRGALTHAYALTADRAQGSTMHTARAVASDATSRAALYVMLSRGSHDVAGYLIRSRDLAAHADDEPWLPVLIDRRSALRTVIEKAKRDRAERMALDADPIALHAHRLQTAHPLRELATLRDAVDRGQRTDIDPRIVRRAEAAAAASVAAAAVADPPLELVAILGPRPAAGANRATWDAAVAAVAVHQARHRPEHADSVTVDDPRRHLGHTPPPADGPATHLQHAHAILTRWADRLPQRQHAGLWRPGQEPARRAVLCGLHALLAAGHSPEHLDAQLDQPPPRDAPAAAVLAARVRQLCQTAELDPADLDLAWPASDPHHDWNRAAQLLSAAQLAHHLRRPVADLAAERDTRPSNTARRELLDAALGAHVATAIDRAATLEPARYLTDLLGPRPDGEPSRLRHWLDLARQVETWRHHHGLPYDQPAADHPNPVIAALGPRPVDDHASAYTHDRLAGASTRLDLDYIPAV